MAGINALKNYFNKVGPLGASLDLGSINLKNPTDLQNFQEALGAPSLSNYFKVSMDLAPSNPRPRAQFPPRADALSGDLDTSKKAETLDDWLTSCGVFRTTDKMRRFELLAVDATLPGTSMAVVQEVGSRQGIRERFATQRQYTDISIGFYITSDYKSLRLFQEWINYMNPIFVGNSGQPFPEGSPGGYPTSGSLNGFHRFRYPNQYKRDIQITKFERDLGKKHHKKEKAYVAPFEDFSTFNPSDFSEDRYTNPDISIHDFGGPDPTPDVMSYNFINAFPISIQDIPLSYGNGQVLQVQVDFSYDRYYVVQSDDLNEMAEVPLGFRPETPLG